MRQAKQYAGRVLVRYALQGSVLALLAGTLLVCFTVKPDTLVYLCRLQWRVGLLLLGLVFCSWFCNSCRVYTLSRSLGYPLLFLQSLAVSVSYEFGIAATPGGLGGAVIRLSLLKRAGVTLADGTSMLAADWALDIVYFALLIPLAMSFSWACGQGYLQETVMEGTKMGFTVLIVGGGILALVGIVGQGLLDRGFERIGTINRLRKHRLYGRFRLCRRRLKTELRQAVRGFCFLFKSRRRSVAFTFVLASVQATCRYSVLPLILYAFTIPHDPVSVFLLQGLLLVASPVLVFPGGGGGVELLAALLLAPAVPGYLVGAVVLLWRLFTYHLYLLGGGTVFLVTCARLNSLFPLPDNKKRGEMVFSSR